MKPNFVRKLKKRSSKQSSQCDEKFIFKSDQRAAIITEKLSCFYKENEFFDTVLIAGSHGDKIQGHRVVLCAFSEYFLEIFRGNQSTSEGNVVELKEIEASQLKLIMDFMYLGSIELSLTTVENILRCASILRMKTLIDGCCEFIEKNINSSNSLHWFQLANELILPRLKDKALNCTYNHFEKISKEKEILMFSENELKDLLFNDNPHADFEEVVFLSVVAWINYDKLKRDHLSFELLSMVRFQSLSPKFIIENRKSVCKTVESYELICSWLEWHLSPKSRLNNQQSYSCKPRTVSDELAVIKHGSEFVVIELLDQLKDLGIKKIEKRLPTKKSYYSAIKIDDKLIVVGGMVDNICTNSVECLDLQHLEWTDLPPITKSRCNCQLADLNGYLCVFGGDESKDLDSIEIYNFSTRQWHEEKMLSKASSLSKISAYDGLLSILDLQYGSLQFYNVISKKWTLKSIEPNPMQGFGFLAFEEFLYVIGGSPYEGSPVYTVERYNLFNDSCCEMASLPCICYSMQSIVFKNKIVILGDEYSLMEYNINLNKWNFMYNLRDSGYMNTKLCTFSAGLEE